MCPPCNGNCNQGRNCPSRKQKGEAIVTILILSLVIAAIPVSISLFSDIEPICGKDGWLRDSYNRHQILDEKGGGIRCHVRE